MAFLKGDPDKKLIRDIDAARTSRDNLIERLKVAEALVPECKAAAQRLAVDSADDAALDRAEDEVRRAQDRVGTFSAALDEIKAQIVVLEKEQADRAGKKQRQATADEIEAIKVELAASWNVLDPAITRATEAARRMSDVVLDAHPLTAFLMNVRTELGPAVTMIVADAEARAKATIAGTAPPTISKASPALVETPKPEPVKLERLFAIQPIMFANTAGHIRRVPRFSHVDLNEQQAAHARRMQVVTDDPQRIKELTRRRASQQLPELHHCFDLDKGTPPSGDPNLMIRHSSTGSGRGVSDVSDVSDVFDATPTKEGPFEIYQGKPQDMMVPVTPAVGTGTRKAEDGEDR
jgi:hypothetical protein